MAALVARRTAVAAAARPLRRLWAGGMVVRALAGRTGTDGPAAPPPSDVPPLLDEQPNASVWSTLRQWTDLASKGVYARFRRLGWAEADEDEGAWNRKRICAALNPKVQQVATHRNIIDFRQPTALQRFVCTSDATVGGTAPSVGSVRSARR